MVEIKDILDRESLKDWLEEVIEKNGEGEGRRIAVIIAHRAGMRALPLFWYWTQNTEHARERDLVAMQVFRASLVSSIAGEMPTPEMGKATAAAANGTAYTSSDVAVYSAAAAAAANIDTGFTGADAFIAAKAANAVEEAAAAVRANTNTNMWVEVRRDATTSLVSKTYPAPLWLGDNPLAEVWTEVKSATMSAPEGPTHWSFWRRWYDDALKGGPPRNPELVKAVALIAPEDWDKGPAFINDVKIPELQAEHARHIASTAAEIKRDQATGAFTEVAVSDLEDGLFRDARDRANEAIADFRTFIDRPQSPYGAFAEDLDLIEAQIARAADRPIRCYENLADGMLKILDIARLNGLEKDSRVTTLVREFERSRRDLRTDDDKIAAREAKRIRIGYDELMDAAQEDFRAMLVGFAEKSDETLEEEMKEDEAAIASTETLEGVRDRALLRSSERMVQMDGIEKEEAKRTSLEDVGKKADAVNKVAKAGETIGKIVEWFLI